LSSLFLAFFLAQGERPHFQPAGQANDMLLTEKHNLISYQTAINEIMNDDLRQVIIEGRNAVQTLQVDLAEEMLIWENIRQILPQICRWQIR